MRVIAGRYRGRKLFSPEDSAVRPTTDRIKETVFNIIQGDVADAVVLDLFAGSGALGIECLSRGAKEVVFADKRRESIQLIKSNLRGIDGEYSVLAGDFMGILRNVRKRFDLIFLDPPYGSGLGEAAIQEISRLDILRKNGIIVFEHAKEDAFVCPTGFKARTKNMGYVTAEFITKSTCAMVTGSFDPITKGHMCVIERAAEDYDRIVVACLVNPDKQYAFAAEDRLRLAQAAVSGIGGVTAVYSEETAVECAAAYGADVLVRGVRGERDLAYEREMAEYNRAHGIETVIYEIDGKRDISSSLVRGQLAEGNYENIPDEAAELLRSGEIKPMR